MTAQFIEKNGRKEFAVLPYAEYQALIGELKDLQALRYFDCNSRYAAEEEEAGICSEVIHEILASVHPIKIMREERDITVHGLAQRCNVSDADISKIENGKQEPSVKLLRAIAEVLETDIDELVI